MPGHQFHDFLIIGGFRTEYIVDLANRSRPDVLGGSALYASGGLRCWNERIVVCGHSAQTHQAEINKYGERCSIDFSGVQFHDEITDDRTFLGYVSPRELFLENPVAFYASRGLAFPRGLIGYVQETNQDQKYGGAKFLPEDFSSTCREAGSCLICQFDLATHLQLASFLLQNATRRLVILSNAEYMTMENFEVMPVLMKGLTSFVTTIDEMRALFRNRMSDAREMAEYLGGLGCETIVMQDDRFGYILFETNSGKRFLLPTYPGNMIDPTGMAEAFCGGFLAGLKSSCDAREALAYGAVSASLTGEGSGPFYCLETLHSLMQSRLRFTRQTIKTD